MLTTLVFILQSSGLQTGLCVPTETVQSFASTVGLKTTHLQNQLPCVCSSVDLRKTYDWMSSKSSFLISCTIFFLPVYHRNEYLSQILHFSMAKGDLGYKQNLGMLPKGQFETRCPPSLLSSRHQISQSHEFISRMKRKFPCLSKSSALNSQIKRKIWKVSWCLIFVFYSDLNNKPFTFKHFSY